MTRTLLEESGLSRGSFRSYLTGFVLALILTGVPFVLVMTGYLSAQATLIAIFGAGFAQILVHLYYFLHLDASWSARWNLGTMIFTVLIMILFVGGTVWIMWSLYYRMHVV